MPTELRKKPKGETQEARRERLDAAKEWRRKFCWNPYRLRHLAGTQARKAFGLEGAQVFLGHSRADVTQIYAERDSGLGERIAREAG